MQSANGEEERNGRHLLRVASAVLAGTLRSCIVGAAVAVPIAVLWEQRSVVAPVHAAPVVAKAPHADGWATVLLGAPSGAEPRPRPVEVHAQQHLTHHEVGAGRGAQDARHTSTGGTERASTLSLIPPPDPNRLPDDFEVVVAKGLTLGEISQTYYGTSRPRWVAALAAYNGLADPNKLRLGQKLRVPHRAKLGLD